jgi:prolyl oligopeptidase
MAHTVDAPPPTEVESITEVLHGVEVTDPYRWLEDQNSPRTRKWLDAQVAYTRAYIDVIAGRDQIKERVKELLALKEDIAEPWSVGDRYFFMKRRANEEQPGIVMRRGLSGPETVVVDPGKRETGESTAIGIIAISEDGRFLAYSVRQGGTDHASLEVLDIESGSVLPDRLPEGFCTGFVFAPDGSGFYYSHRELVDPRPNYRAVLWHRFGTDRLQDRELFFAGEGSDLFLGILHSSEAKLLAYIVFRAGKMPSTAVYLQEAQVKPSKAKLLLQQMPGSFAPFFVRGQLLAYSDLKAPNGRIVRINLDDPDPSNWRDVVPESDRRIQQFAVAGNDVFVTRVDRFSTRVQAFDIDGSQRESISFPAHTTIDLLNRTTSSNTVFYSETCVSEPAATSCYDPHDRQAFVWEKPGLSIDLPVIEVDETEFSSKDGTRIPIFLAARKYLLHSGALPTFLTGYGGFGSCVTPRFTAFATYLMEQGFLLAVPALRGGSELGEQWHSAGKCGHRQKTFDDFVAAAEWLIERGRSLVGRIAIGGGSNAGLLVGAAVTQRPDLFRAAICLGPLLDMTRYHLFDQAARWADEYGSPEEEQDFHSLLDFSPYHHVRGGVDYPAVMFFSGDSDTRCNPMHARKMAARLQAASCSGRPILLEYRSAWGHTPVQPLSTRIEALTDRLAFVCHELGVTLQGGRAR